MAALPFVRFTTRIYALSFFLVRAWMMVGNRAEDCHQSITHCRRKHPTRFLLDPSTRMFLVPRYLQRVVVVAVAVAVVGYRRLRIEAANGAHTEWTAVYWGVLVKHGRGGNSLRFLGEHNDTAYGHHCFD